MIFLYFCRINVNIIYFKNEKGKTRRYLKTNEML